MDGEAGDEQETAKRNCGLTVGTSDRLDADIREYHRVSKIEDEEFYELINELDSGATAEQLWSKESKVEIPSYKLWAKGLKRYGKRWPERECGIREAAFKEEGN